MNALVWKLPIAIGGAVLLYLWGAALVRNFARGHDQPADDEVVELEDVDYHFRCVVCSTQVVMYAAPNGEIPLPPRHCAERMDLVATLE
jgi:hypothetical protein